MLILRELGLIFGPTEMPIRTHAETLVHSTVILLGFVLLASGALRGSISVDILLNIEKDRRSFRD